MGPTCGGPLNNPYYFYNPVYAFCLKTQSEFQLRIRVSEEEKVLGQKNVDPTSFTYAANASVFRINQTFPPVGIAFSPSFTPCLSTNGGSYTAISGALVSERVFFDFHEQKNNVLETIGSRYISHCAIHIRD